MSSYSQLKILVLGARERHGLVIVRSLGKLGCQVYTGESFAWSTASLSKYCRGEFRYADPEKHPTRFLDDLEKILRENKFDFVFAVSDVLPILLGKNKARFEAYTRLAVTDWQSFELANDKARTFEIARAEGIPAPQTWVLRSPADLEAIAPELDFPVVLKPSSKTQVGAKRGDSIKASYAYSRPELTELYEKVGTPERAFLLQEYVPGSGGEGVGALFHQGEPRALFSYRRVHEYPISGGTSTLRESTDDKDLKAKAEKLLRALRWDGVAMVEFKRDLRSGEAKLIEVNGRYWGSLALPVECGVDFPALHLKQLLGEKATAQPSYRVGCRVRWFLPGDIMFLFQKLGAVGPKYLGEYLKKLFVRDDVWRWSDPLPILGEIRASFFYLRQVLRGQRSWTGEFKG